MPATLTDYTQQAQEQTLKVIRDSQEGVVEAVRAWASAIEKAVPAGPEIPALPLADEFPSAKEIVETSFGFAEQLLHDAAPVRGERPDRRGPRARRERSRPSRRSLPRSPRSILGVAEDPWQRQVEAFGELRPSAAQAREALASRACRAC